MQAITSFSTYNTTPKLSVMMTYIDRFIIGLSLYLNMFIRNRSPQNKMW